VGKLRAPELKKLYGITRHQAYNLARKKRIPHSRIGRMVIFDKDELDTWFEKFKVKTN
jgi:excisionase family DNA binding protein